MGRLFRMFRALYSTLGAFEGQITIFPKEKYYRLVQVTKCVDTVDFGMSNSRESILVVKPFLNQSKGCVRYIFTSLFFKSKTRALAKLGKMFFISFQKLFSFSRKSNFSILDFQIS